MRKLMFIISLATLATTSFAGTSNYYKEILPKCSQENREYIKQLDSKRQNLGSALACLNFSEADENVTSRLVSQQRFDISKKQFDRLLIKQACTTLTDYRKKNNNISKVHKDSLESISDGDLVNLKDECIFTNSDGE